MDKNRYMTTGEFAALMHVTKETLFHYDRIGLFSPEIKSENGYRLYNIMQADRMNTILVLREMDVPLAQIKDFLERQEPERLLQLFEQEEVLIQEQIRKLKDRQQWMKRQREKIRIAKTADFSSIYRKQRPKLYYRKGNVEGDTAQEFTRAIHSLIAEYEEENNSICYEIGYFQDMRNIREQKYQNYTNVLILTENRPKGKKAEALEAGEYLTAYHAGHWEEIGNAYRRLLEYADREGIRLADVSLERDLVDFMMAKEEKNYVTEINVRILP